jgi:hypothetical protein
VWREVSLRGGLSSAGLREHVKVLLERRRGGRREQLQLTKVGILIEKKKKKGTVEEKGRGPREKARNNS